MYLANTFGWHGQGHCIRRARKRHEPFRVYSPSHCFISLLSWLQYCKTAAKIQENLAPSKEKMKKNIRLNLINLINLHGIGKTYTFAAEIQNKRV